MKKYLMMLAAGLLTVSLGGCAVVTDSSQTDSVEVEEVAEEAKDDTEKNDTEQEETDEPAWYGSWKIIDVKAAAAHDVAVTITPGANGDSVADMAMALMLDCARNVTTMDNSIKARNQVRPQGLEMWEKTLGVVGAGRIGKGVAKRCTGFNMRILCYDQYQDEAFKKECGAEYVDLDTLIRESDFITIHSPLTPETKHMFSTAQFKAMKNEAILVNTARGGIVNEHDLYEAVKSGHIAGAALDVSEQEPMAEDNPLRTLDVLLSMLHCATYPYVKEEHTFESWMDVLAQYATAYPVLVEWFLLYVNESLAPPDGRKGKVSRPKS